MNLATLKPLMPIQESTTPVRSPPMNLATLKPVIPTQGSTTPVRSSVKNLATLKPLNPTQGIPWPSSAFSMPLTPPHLTATPSTPMSPSMTPSMASSTEPFDVMPLLGKLTPVKPTQKSESTSIMSPPLTPTYSKPNYSTPTPISMQHMSSQPLTVRPLKTYFKSMKSASRMARSASKENVSQMLSKLKPMDTSELPATLIPTPMMSLPSTPMNTNPINFKSMSPIPLKSLMPKPSTKPSIPSPTSMPKSVNTLPFKSIPQQTFNVMPVLANLKPMKPKDSKTWTLESV